MSCSDAVFRVFLLPVKSYVKPQHAVCSRAWLLLHNSHQLEDAIIIIEN